ncbi:MAG: sugar phosphate isomerase/epimerase family protein, partial [Planctomycetota bacterium]
MPTASISFHTDAFNSTHKSFEQCLQWARHNGVHQIEPGVIEGACWIHGLGYFPHISLLEDPALLREKMAGYGVSFSQIDAAYPLSGKCGPTVGVPYVMKSIAWAALAGSPRDATTDGLHKPKGLSDDEAMELMKRSYRQIIEVAEAHRIVVTIEVHGYFTTNPDRLEQMLDFCGDSPWLRLNLDTGNSFIAGQDPVAFAKRFLDKIHHVHVKDVSESLAQAVRGGQTGIAISHCATGDGVNADNIRACMKLLYDRDFDGAFSIECEGQGGPMIEKSLAWVRQALS